MYKTPNGLMMKKSNAAAGAKMSNETTQETDKDTKTTKV
jgi:hypothetical protein